MLFMKKLFRNFEFNFEVFDKNSDNPLVRGRKLKYWQFNRLLKEFNKKIR